MTIGGINSYGGYGIYNNGNIYGVQKSSGLTDFYNSLFMNLNANKGGGNSAALQSAMNIKGLGQKLDTIIDGLTGYKTGRDVFKQLTAVSSDSNLITASVDPKKANTNKLQNSSFDIEISQLAKAQENAGVSMKSTDKILSSGSYGFSVEIGGKVFYTYYLLLNPAHTF